MQNKFTELLDTDVHSYSMQYKFYSDEKCYEVWEKSKCMVTVAKLQSTHQAMCTCNGTTYNNKIRQPTIALLHKINVFTQL